MESTRLGVFVLFRCMIDLRCPGVMYMSCVNGTIPPDTSRSPLWTVLMMGAVYLIRGRSWSVFMHLAACAIIGRCGPPPRTRTWVIPIFHGYDWGSIGWFLSVAAGVGLWWCFGAPLHDFLKRGTGHVLDSQGGWFLVGSEPSGWRDRSG